MSNWYDSAYVVPLGAFAVAITAIAGGIIGQAHARRVKAEQRMAMLSRGVPMAEIEAVLNRDRDHDDEPRRAPDPMRRMNNARTTAMVLLSTGAGLMLFFVLLAVILQTRPVLAAAAAGVIPFCIGVGFLFDYQAQRREMSRFGLVGDGDGV